MSEQLKPCPFCGRVVGPRPIRTTRADGKRRWGVQCDEDLYGCGAWINPRHATKAGATDEWNRRAAPEVTP